MANVVKELAERYNTSITMLIETLEQAGISGKTEDSEVTSEERGIFLRELLKGRVQTTQQGKKQTLPATGKSGDKREITVQLKQAQQVAPRPLAGILPVLDIAELEVEAEADTEQLEEAEIEVSPEDVAVDEQTVEPEKDAEVEATAQPEVQPAVVDQIEGETEKQSEPVAVEVKKTSPPPKKPKPKRKSARSTEIKEREQLHVVRGSGKLRKERERRTKSPIPEESHHKHGFKAPQAPVVIDVAISDSNSIGDLARAMSVKASGLIKKLFEVGQIVTINDSIDKDVAYYLVEEMGHVPVEAAKQDLEASLVNLEADKREQIPRPPVVAVMGHVDHGKTTLLDCIRSTKVAASEKGGITQHIGAYMVETSKGKITFFDTPGHEAFAAMRVRGAKATDIVILVVAADDGVKPQTIEAINHARNADVPIIVAINKIDKRKSDPSRVLRELTEHSIVVEELGGDVLVVQVSALKQTGVDTLLESVELQAELLDLQAPVEGLASGVVIEARVDKGRGVVVTVLVQKGTLQVKDFVVAGIQRGKVRELTDYRSGRVKKATPSMPVEIVGFQEVPVVGDDFVCVPDDKTAQQLSDFRLNKVKKTSGLRPNEIAFGGSDEPKVVNVLIKADVRGSAEALSNSIKNLSNEEVEVKVIHDMVGGISQSDVNLALAADALIIAFNVRAEATARNAIDEHKIKVIYSGVIYDAIDAVREVIASKVEPKVVEEVVARVEVREVFKLTKVGTIAGCYVQDGAVRSNLAVRVLRNNIMIHNGVIDSLRRFKNDVSEVKAGLECGIQVRNYHDLSIEDHLEVYQSREI